MFLVLPRIRPLLQKPPDLLGLFPFPFLGDPLNEVVESLRILGAPLHLAYPGDGIWMANHVFMKKYKHMGVYNQQLC